MNEGARTMEGRGVKEVAGESVGLGEGCTRLTYRHSIPSPIDGGVRVKYKTESL